MLRTTSKKVKTEIFICEERKVFSGTVEWRLPLSIKHFIEKIFPDIKM